ncbi:hypothetical protein P9C02_21335 [Bacillus paralicheniformis]|uniref:hypothetical protein n=1 Tax=Bacillus paralicheniformis TaxID=1648923 RepID=UPI002DBCBDE2|nr:hypothetical protein [Bacillus paralicheniformis]MEC1192994.1 hypothetical protein [Bacillus paralicheniformis]
MGNFKGGDNTEDCNMLYFTHQNIGGRTLINFDSNKFKQILDVVSNPPNPKDTKVRSYYSDQEYVSFELDFENVDVALRIAGLLGKHATNFTITTLNFPDTNKIDSIQFMVFKINDAELLKILDQI